MASYTPCEGSGRNAVDLIRYPGQPGRGVLDPGSPSKTFGNCPGCGRTVMSGGLVNSIKVSRHKAQQGES